MTKYYKAGDVFFFKVSDNISLRVSIDGTESRNIKMSESVFHRQLDMDLIEDCGEPATEAEFMNAFNQTMSKINPLINNASPFLSELELSEG